MVSISIRIFLFLHLHERKIKKNSDKIRTRFADFICRGWWLEDDQTISSTYHLSHLRLPHSNWGRQIHISGQNAKTDIFVHDTTNWLCPYHGRLCFRDAKGDYLVLVETTSWGSGECRLVTSAHSIEGSCYLFPLETRRLYPSQLLWDKIYRLTPVAMSAAKKTYVTSPQR